MRKVTPLRARLESKTEERPNGCLIFTGLRSREGYGRIGLGLKGEGTRRMELAHRAAYILRHGSIPVGLSVDHQCHNDDLACTGGPSCPHRACVNPDHLVARPIQENQLGGRHNGAKTHCPRGHLYDVRNTRVDVNGSRNCRACGRDKARARRAARNQKLMVSA
jgi:hypothetical protein